MVFQLYLVMIVEGMLKPAGGLLLLRLLLLLLLLQVFHI
jgi:hypothetical protein